MAIQSSILAWGKSWIEEPGGLQFIVLDMTECMRARARAHTHTHTHTHTHQQNEGLGWRRGLNFFLFPQKLNSSACSND